MKFLYSRETAEMIGKVIALCAEEKEFFQTFGMFQEVHAIKSCFVAIFVFEDHCM